MEDVSQCIKNIRAIALQEKANGNKAINAPKCRIIKNPAISLLNVSLGFMCLSVGTAFFSNRLLRTFNFPQLVTILTLKIQIICKTYVIFWNKEVCPDGIYLLIYGF